MRIYGNRLLKTLSGQKTRPTTGKVREALFNMWRGKIQDCAWLDLCAGNGIMSAEALCRGAKTVVTIEQNGKACQVIRENLNTVQQSEQTVQIIRGNVLTQLNRLAGQQFDRIYFDPPYSSSLYDPVLKAIASLQLLAPEGEIAVEHDSKQWEVPEIESFEIMRSKSYGKTALSFYGNALNV